MHITKIVTVVLDFQVEVAVRGANIGLELRTCIIKYGHTCREVEFLLPVVVTRSLQEVIAMVDDSFDERQLDLQLLDFCVSQELHSTQTDQRLRAINAPLRAENQASIVTRF